MTLLHFPPYGRYCPNKIKVPYITLYKILYVRNVLFLLFHLYAVYAPHGIVYFTDKTANLLHVGTSKIMFSLKSNITCYKSVKRDTLCKMQALVFLCIV